MFGNKKAKENSLENIDALQKEAAENLTGIPGEEAEEVHDENTENLTHSKEGTEDRTSPQSPESDSSLGEQTNVDVEAVIAENKAMKEEITNLRKALEQSAELSKEGVAAVAVGEGDDVDFSAFVYGDESERKTTSKKLFGQLLSALREEAAPILAERDDAKRATDMAKAIKVLSEMEDDFPGFGTQVDELNALIGRNAILKAHTVPMEQMIAAYIMNAGLKAIDKGKSGMSVDELMNLYRENEEFRGAIEKDRLEKLKDEPELPPMPVSSSMSTHEPYTHDAPETMEEANKSLREMRRKLRK